MPKSYTLKDSNHKILLEHHNRICLSDLWSTLAPPGGSIDRCTFEWYFLNWEHLFKTIRNYYT